MLRMKTMRLKGRNFPQWEQLKKITHLHICIIFSYQHVTASLKDGFSYRKQSHVCLYHLMYVTLYGARCFLCVYIMSKHTQTPTHTHQQVFGLVGKAFYRSDTFSARSGQMNNIYSNRSDRHFWVTLRGGWYLGGGAAYTYSCSNTCPSASDRKANGSFLFTQVR